MLIEVCDSNSMDHGLVQLQDGPNVIKDILDDLKIDLRDKGQDLQEVLYYSSSCKKSN